MSSIACNFNNTPIAPGSTIWFSSVFKQPSNLGTGPTTVEVTNQTITFKAGGTNYSVTVPDASITLDASNTTASTSFDPTANEWNTNLPLQFGGNAFLDGVALTVPNGLPGGIQSVTWQGMFTGSVNNIGMNWQWGAAVYKNFGTDYNTLNVKPVDGDKPPSPISNGDHAGTPEAFKADVTAGATGGGGNNFTGNFSPGGNVTTSLIGSALVYPFASSNPLTSIAFNESSVLVAAQLDTTNGFFKLWYTDEHAMTLGVRQVNVITASGTTTTNYAIAPLTTDPGAAANPALGTTALSGDQAGTDTSGRPLSPFLYITDTTNNPNSLSGDWQYGGTGYAPSSVFGAWKGAVRTVNQTTATPTVTVVCDADPAQNHWTLGPGSDAPPAGTSNSGYGTEVRWDLNALFNQGVLQAGHTYRFYVMVHDGDQNKAGGDVGQAAFNYNYPGPPVSQLASLSGFFTGTTGGANESGVLITLTGTTVSGQSVTLTTYTAADGSYSFQGLQAGTYAVAETLPAAVSNYVPTSSPGTVNGSLDGTGTGGLITSITLHAGDNGINYDFGDYLPTL
jgi:hypothetical protein